MQGRGPQWHTGTCWGSIIYMRRLPPPPGSLTDMLVGLIQTNVDSSCEFLWQHTTCYIVHPRWLVASCRIGHSASCLRNCQ